MWSDHAFFGPSIVQDQVVSLQVVDVLKASIEGTGAKNTVVVVMESLNTVDLFDNVRNNMDMVFVQNKVVSNSKFYTRV
jgi:hypothetical protein